MGAKRGIVAVALVAVALAGMGCGGDDEESAGDTQETTTAAPDPARAPAPTQGPAGAVLRGSVGPGFEIDLTTDDGASVSTLAPGTYRLEVEDLSTIHNFRMGGPGVNVATAVGEEGSESFEVELEPGTYQFLCDPHASSMSGSFEVG